MIPLAVGVSSYGMVYGMMARQAELSLASASFMSLWVFAGASQLIALDMWISPLPVAAIVLTTLIVNIRHLLMGASLTPYMQGERPRSVLASLFFMTDESWAFTVKEMGSGESRIHYLLGSGLCLYIMWFASSVTGHLLGAVIDDPAKWGLDFTFTAVFLILLVGMYRSRRDIPSWVVAAAVAIVTAYFIPGKWYIFTGGIAGSLTGAFTHDA